MITTRVGWQVCLGLALSGGMLLAESSALVLASDQNVDIIGVGGGYNPPSVTVDPGNTVTWTNRDQTAAHNAVCSASADGCPVDMAPDGGKLEATGKSQSFTFQYSGTYNYHCAAHSSMRGTVVVTGNVHPPSSQGGGTGTTNGGGTPGARPAGGGTGSGAGGQTGTTSGGTTSGGGSHPATNPGATTGNSTDATSAGQAVRDSLVGVNLPRPNVILKTSPGGHTPQWVLLATAVAMVVCGVLFALAWFGPPLRLSGRSG